MLVLATAALGSSLAAQGWIEPIPGRPGIGVVKVRSAVSVEVAGRIARIEVEEWFRNDGPRLGEGDYLYPLPGEAVFGNFSLFQGDRELTGETMDAAQARRIYEEIVRRKRDPALIELAGHGLIRSRVFPINPGETRKITLRYTQILRRAGDALEFHYAAGLRNAGTRAPLPEGATLPRGVREPAPLSFTLRADSGAAYHDPFSPTHEISVTRSDGRLTVRPAGDLDGDFTLFLPLARGLVGVTLATHRPAGEDGYFMLTLSPGAAAARALERDITVVLDVSGSMSGSKLEQAKAAIVQLLGSLGGRDRFRLLTFSNGVTVYRPQWTRASASELEGARRWVETISANGGTNIAGALTEAFRAGSPRHRLPMVVFVTDGLPSVGEQNPERIAARAEADRGRARVFAFGVGHDVNTYLLDRLSAAGRGTTEYVLPGEDVEQALGDLAAKIQHPVLTDLAIAGAPVRLLEVYPSTLPDLFAGEELVVFGRYRRQGGSARGEIAMTGRRNGRAERFALTAEFPEHALGNEFIPRLWASRKIGELSRTIHLEGHSSAIEREIRETALRYGLLTEFTSYLVQEPEVIARQGSMQLRRAWDRMAQMSRPAAAPSAAVGAGAVQASEQARIRREARSVAALEAADEALLDGPLGPSARHVAGRLFVEMDGVWTDLRHNDSLRTLDIAPFSDAYFAVLERLPEIRPYVVELPRVLVAGERLSIRIAAGGEEQLSVGELSRLVREFRRR